MTATETVSAQDSVNEELLRADEPGEEFRSIWTDLRGVSFSQGWLDVKGVRIRYLRSGNAKAPKLVMLPGTGGHAETYVANLGPLGAAFDCWAIDVPGSGYSDKPEQSYDSISHAAMLKDFAEVTGATELNLIGCSVGSWTALRAAINYPDLVRRVILCSPAGGPMPEKDDPWYALWMNPQSAMGGEQDVRHDNARNPTWEQSEKILRSLIPDRRRLPDDMIAARLDANRQPGAGDVVEKVNWWLDFDARMKNTVTRAELRAVRQPVLGVCEAEDRLLLLNRAMFACIPNSKLIRIEGVGHWPHYEAPAQFNRLALGFLTKPR
jgi:2-hydroxy-6-oxonona-2,4-dienedioate hydrolase